MKKVLFIIIFLNFVLIAQTEQRDVELPDFVITGRQRIEVQSVMKSKPELMKIISEDFLFPKYPPEEIPLLISSQTKPVVPSLDDLTNAFFGNLYVGLGRYTYPVGELNLNKSLDYYLLHAKVFGSNIKDYVEYSGYNASGASIDNNFYISTKSKLLQGTEIKLNGSYFRDSYKFFGSYKPDSLRETNRTYGNFSISNNYNRWINIGLYFQAKFLSVNDISLKEKLIEGTSFAELKFSKLIFGGNLYYKKQYLQNNLSGIDNYDYYTFNGYAKVYAIKNIFLNAGLTFSKNNSNNFIAPFGSIEMKISDEIKFTGEFKPFTRFLTILDFIDNNLYMTNKLKDNVYDEIPFNISTSIAYENKNMFYLKLFGEYKKHNNYLYFEDVFDKGYFDVNSIDSREFTFGINAMYNSSFYGKYDVFFNYRRVKDVNGNILPYNPVYNLSASFYYDFNFGLSFNASYSFFAKSYADIKNRIKIEDYSNLSFGLIYKLFKSLSVKADFQNILNKSNFVLNGYKGKSFDIILGVEYRWQ